MSKKSTVNLQDRHFAIEVTKILKIDAAAQERAIEKLKADLKEDGTKDLSLVEKALIYATIQHCYQDRKYEDDVPYIVHPIDVAINLSSLDFRPEVIAAAVLHDTVEDTPATYEEIFEIFGNTVSNFVKFLTDDSDGLGNRKVRKEHDRKRLASAPAEVQSIKVADLIDNSASIIKNDPDFARVYIKEKEVLLDSLDKAHPQLIKEARQIIDKYNASKPA